MRIQHPTMRSRFAYLLVALVTCTGMTRGVSPEASEAPQILTYQMEYAIDITDSNDLFVSLTVTQLDGELKRLTLVGLNDSHKIEADKGQLDTSVDGSVWQVPATGGRLTWRSPASHRRANGTTDALRTDQWAVLRTEDAIPPIASVTRPNADAVTRLRLRVPDGWSIAVPYEKIADNLYAVDDAGRRFDKPDGWMAVGNIGIRRTEIAGTKIAIAGPRDVGARRVDTLAFLRWHMPIVRELFPDFPDRVLVAMAGDPFFRGGLSAPNSLFMHVDRPMISGNGTSSVIHELVHIGFSRTAVDGEDWIVEGVAEYYSHELLRRAGTTSEKRSQRTRQSLADWAQKSKQLQAQASSGSRTALAAGVFAALDAEVRRRTASKTLDNVIRLLANKPGKVDLEELRRAARDVIGAAPRSLTAAALPGYANGEQRSE